MPSDRVLRSEQQAIRSYDRLSRWYDWLSVKSEWPLTQAGLDALNLYGSERVLEIGPGTGNALCALSNQASFVVGLDISAGMLSVAQAKLKTERALPRIPLVRGSALFPPFQEGSFDVVFLSFTLELFDTPVIPQILTHCRFLLASAGRLGVVALAYDQQEPFSQRVYGWFHEHFPAYVDCRPIDTRNAIQEAGFTLTSFSRAKMWGLAVDICVAGKNS